MRNTDGRYPTSGDGKKEETTNLISQFSSDGDGVSGARGSEGRNRGSSGQLGKILWGCSGAIYFPTAETIDGVRFTRDDACDGQCQSLRSGTQKGGTGVGAVSHGVLIRPFYVQAWDHGYRKQWFVDVPFVSDAVVATRI